MKWFKRNPWLGVVLVGCFLAGGIESWLLRVYYERATQATVRLENKRQERDWLARQSPAPSAANEQAIIEDLKLAAAALADLRETLQTRPAARPPDKPIDAYFDIAAFVEKTRGLAARARVTLRPEERFGFGAHRNEGPEAGLVPAVFRQRVAAQELVEALLEARPQELVAVHRERPQTAAGRNPSGPVGPGPAHQSAFGAEAADFFEFVRAESLRVPGRVESDVFRLEFTGQTPALRAFLNSLAVLKVPAIVRRVEVEPLSMDSAMMISQEGGAAVPLVAQNLSRFAVTVECVELLAAGGPSTP
jgi:hypothetical protein